MPLLPTAGGAARLPVQQRLARRPARLLLLALLAVCVVKAAWNSQSLLCAWRRGGGDQRSLASEPIVAVQLQQEAAPAPRTSGSAAGANETASGSGSSNKTVVLGSGKSKAAGTASSTASKAAGITGSIASQAAASAGNASRPAVSWAWEERPDGQPPPAELPLPIVEAASNVSCAQALGAPKVALLFLTRGPMHHEEMWRLWFASAAGMLPIHSTLAAACSASPEQYQALRRACTAQLPPLSSAAALAGGKGADRKLEEDSLPAAAGGTAVTPEQQAAAVMKAQHLFGVYVHAPPSFPVYPAGSLWEGSLISRRIATAWGDMSLVEATRSLLWEAFKDPLNQRFVLVSESDIPLYDPLTLYQQLMSESKSRIKACSQPWTSAYRWSLEMGTCDVSPNSWRKSSQFFMMTREHVAAVLEDTAVYRCFERHCWQGWSARRNFYRDCVGDEHYFATLLAILGRQRETECSTWGMAAQDWSQGGPHPKSFMPEEVSPALVQHLRDPALCNSSAAHAAAQRLFVDARQLPADPQVACSRLRDAAAAAGPFQAMPGACYLTARKFPANTTEAVLWLFNSSCDGAGAGGSGSSEAVHLLSGQCSRLSDAL